jgi:hypothetical protein
MNYFSNIVLLAGYPAIFSIRYVAGYQIQYPTGYKKSPGLSGRPYIRYISNDNEQQHFAAVRILVATLVPDATSKDQKDCSVKPTVPLPVQLADADS